MSGLLKLTKLEISFFDYEFTGQNLTKRMNSDISYQWFSEYRGIEINLKGKIWVRLA